MTADTEVLSISSASVIESSLVAFGAGMTLQSRTDAKNAYLYASLVANKKFDAATEAENWFQMFLTVMQDCGWVTAHRTYEKETSSSQSVKVGSIAVKAIKLAASFIPGASVVGVLGELASSAIQSLPEHDEPSELFKRNVNHKIASVVGLASCIETADGEVVMALGAIHREVHAKDVDVLFFDWDSASAETYMGTAALSLNKNLYGAVRETIEQKLQERAVANILDYDI